MEERVDAEMPAILDRRIKQSWRSGASTNQQLLELCKSKWIRGEVAASAMNGAIHAHGMTAEVRATTLNGDVDVSAATVPEATTLNGNVTASFASAPRGKVELSTNNGNVRANLPSGVDADIDAETSNGEIMVTFPMAIDAVPGGFGPKSGHARLGKGGARIDAHTTNGNVEIKTAG